MDGRHGEEMTEGDKDESGSGNERGIPWSQQQLIMLWRSSCCLRFPELASQTSAAPRLLKTRMVLQLM